MKRTMTRRLVGRMWHVALPSLSSMLKRHHFKRCGLRGVIFSYASLWFNIKVSEGQKRSLETENNRCFGVQGSHVFLCPSSNLGCVDF